MMKKITLVIISFIIIYYKPTYGVLFFILCSFDYIFFLNYIYKFFNNKNHYCRFEVTMLDVSNSSVLEIWIEYNKLQAFQKFYNLFKKKKINFKDIIKVVTLFVLQIPLKFLKLLWFFLIKNKENFKIGLEILYLKSYNTLKYCKIEVLGNDRFINCFTIKTLLHSLQNENRLITHFHLVKTLDDLRDVSRNFQTYEQRMGNYRFLSLISAKNMDGQKIFSPHFGYIEGKNSIHSTSNVPYRLLLNQQLNPPMPSLIKSGALKPRTIISKNIDVFVVHKKQVLVPEFELAVVIHRNADDFALDHKMYEYLNGKERIYKEILQTNLKLDKVRNLNIIEELMSNNYDQALTSLTEEELVDALDSMSSNRDDSEN